MNTNATNMKKMITWPITIKLLKISDKKKSKIATEKKRYIIYKRTKGGQQIVTGNNAKEKVVKQQLH